MSSSINHVKCQYLLQLLPMVPLDGKMRYSFGLPAWISETWEVEKLDLYTPPDFGTILLFDWLDHVHDYTLLGRLKSTHLRIFITHCHRKHYWTWGYQHFNEMSPDRAKKLFKYYGFEVVQESHVVIWREWYKYFRPRTFMRLFFGWQHHYAYEIRYKKQ